jgi:hypothetical protein
MQIQYRGEMVTVERIAAAEAEAPEAADGTVYVAEVGGAERRFAIKPQRGGAQGYAEGEQVYADPQSVELLS